MEIKTADIRVDLSRGNFTETAYPKNYKFVCWEGDIDCKKLINKAFDEGYDFIQVKIPIISPTCFDCKHSKKYAGSFGSRIDPPEPATAECQLNEETVKLIDESYDSLYEGIAEFCPSFLPEETGSCGLCGKKIMHPKYSWKLFVMGWDEEPCCSVECKDKLQKKIDKEFKELNKSTCHTDEYYFNKGWEIIRCPTCNGYGVVSNYSMYDFEGAKFCNTCEGAGKIWKTPKGRHVEFPGGKFV